MTDGRDMHGHKLSLSDTRAAHGIAMEGCSPKAPTRPRLQCEPAVLRGQWPQDSRSKIQHSQDSGQDGFCQDRRKKLAQLVILILAVS